MKSSKNLKSLKLSVTGYYRAYLSPETLKLIETQSQEIEHFELSWVNMSSIDMVTSFTKLKCLRLNQIDWREFSPNAVISLAKNCPKLDTIEFDDIRSHDKTSTFLAFDTFFHEKQSILKSVCFKKVLVNSVPTDEFLRNLSLCHNLEEFQSQKTYLTQTGLDIISTLPNLKKLIFHDISITSKTMRHFLKNLNKTNLECLFISKCSGFDEYSFKDLSNLSFPKLERLFIYKDTVTPGLGIDFLVKQIIQNSPCIKSIQFNDNIEFEENLTNDFVTETTKQSKVLVSWQQKENWTLAGMTKQWRVEKYLKEHEGSVFEKYMEMKKEFVKWCQINDMERIFKNT